MIEGEDDKAGKDGSAGDKDAKADPKEYFGYQRDLESMCEFMGRWLSENHRWGSPVYIAGESYGGYRVGRLVRMLQESTGIGLNGAILISPALEITPLSPTDYDITGWIDTLPVMALSAVHHGRSRAFEAGTDSATVLSAAEAFATGDYTTFLTRGAAMPEGERDRILTSHADLIGLSVDFVRRAEGRIPIGTFARELLRDERRVLGTYDTTVTVTDPFPDRDSFSGPDPTLSGASAAFTMGINRLLRSEIGVDTDREYTLLSYEVDPYFASDRLRNLMRLDPVMTDRLTVQHYGGGHMFYAWEASRVAFTDAIASFYEQSA